nr:unnamed protein product [Ananas comosus var. bracteatus]
MGVGGHTHPHPHPHPNPNMMANMGGGQGFPAGMGQQHPMGMNAGPMGSSIPAAVQGLPAGAVPAGYYQPRMAAAAAAPEMNPYQQYMAALMQQQQQQQQQMMMNSMGYLPPPPMGYGYGRAPYMMPPPPHQRGEHYSNMFSDENPNSCSLM